jgi:protease-4
VFFEKAPSGWMNFFAEVARGGDKDDDDWSDEPAGPDAFARIAAERNGLFIQAIGDARRLALGESVQVRCLECAGIGPAMPTRDDRTLFQILLARFIG